MNARLLINVFSPRVCKARGIFACANFQNDEHTLEGVCVCAHQQQPHTKKHRHELHARISPLRLRERLIESMFCHLARTGGTESEQYAPHIYMYTSTASPVTPEPTKRTHRQYSLRVPCYLRVHFAPVYMCAPTPRYAPRIVRYKFSHARAHAIFQVIYKCKTPTANEVCMPPQRQDRTRTAPRAPDESLRVRRPHTMAHRTGAHSRHFICTRCRLHSYASSCACACSVKFWPQRHCSRRWWPLCVFGPTANRAGLQTHPPTTEL